MEDFILEQKKYLVEVLGKKLIDSDEYDKDYRRLAKKYWPEEFKDGTKKVVHHIDFDRTNNVVSNLVVLNYSEHEIVHLKFDINFINGMLNKHHSEETKQRLSELHKGKPSPIKGKHLSEEAKKKISEKAKLRTGEKNPFYKKHHSEETKKKISESLKNK